MSENGKKIFLNNLFGAWESNDSKAGNYHLTISRERLLLKKIEEGKEVELENCEYFGSFDSGSMYLMRCSKSTYCVLSLSSEELVLGRGIGSPVSPQFEIVAHFRK